MRLVLAFCAVALWSRAGAAVAAAVPDAPIPLTFASSRVMVTLGPADVLLALKRERQRAGHKDPPELLRKLPLAVSVSSGDGAIEVDLTGLNVATLTVTTQAAPAEVTLPAEGSIRGTLRSGSGALTLYTPSSRSVSFNIVGEGGGYIGVEGGVRQRGGATSQFDASSGGGTITAEPLAGH